MRLTDGSVAYFRFRRNMIIIVMGVCGSGKTTIGSSLAKKLNCSFADADEFHSAENKKKMSLGQPLTDQDRYPWLCSIHRYMVRLDESNQSGVVTCSALKKVYRNILRKGDIAGKELKVQSKDINNEKEQNDENGIKPTRLSLPEHGLDISFIHLSGSVNVLQERMQSRQGHFMPPALLQSQLETIEPLQEDETGVLVDVAGTSDDIVMHIIQRLNIGNL